MEIVEGSGQIVQEPDWESVFSDVLDIAAAREHWRVVSLELRERNLLSPTNGHAMRRLINSWILYDKFAQQVAEHGAMTKPKRGNPKSIARLSPYFVAMRETATDAANLEAELGLSPRRRGGVSKVDNAKKAPRAADRFLAPKRA